MGKDPAVLFYTSDFLTGTAFFTKAQRGEYITLLCEQHQLWSIPEEHLIEICGSLESPVAKKFKKDKNGSWFNIRMREETERRKKYNDSRRENAISRWSKKDKPLSEKKIDVMHVDKHVDKHVDMHMGTRTRTRTLTVIEDPLWVLKTEDGFKEYLKISEPDWDRLQQDWEWIEKMKNRLPYTNIRESMEVSWDDYWGTKAGWENKIDAYQTAKKKAIKEKTDFNYSMNWMLTIQKTLKLSQVKIPYNSPDVEMQHIEMMKRQENA